MKTKKTPAPKRAGTQNRGSALVQLNWLRVNRPEAYSRVMVAVAQLVAVTRALDD